MVVSLFYAKIRILKSMCKILRHFILCSLRNEQNKGPPLPVLFLLKSIVDCEFNYKLKFICCDL